MSPVALNSSKDGITSPTGYINPAHNKIYITDTIPHFKVISQKLSVYRAELKGKILPVFAVLIGALLAFPLAAAWQPSVYLPDMQKKVPLYTIDPSYLWKHIDDPALRYYNDMSSVQTYLEQLGTTFTPTKPLTQQDLLAMGIKKIYDHTIQQWVPVEALLKTQIQTLLQNPLSRAYTLAQNRLRPMTLKAYYQQKNQPLPVIQVEPLFHNSELCITWILDGRFVRQTPPGCGT